MKILVSSVGKQSTDSVDPRFGRGDYFQIFDTETKEYKAIENVGKNSDHGAGIGASQQVIDENVDVVITGHLGPNAYNFLSESNIRTYSCNEGSVEQAINLYIENKLEKIDKAGSPHRA